MEEKRLNIILALGTDKNSVSKATAQMEKMLGEMRELEAEAKDLRESIGKALAGNENSDRLQAQLKLVESSIDRLKAKTASAAGGLFAKEAANFNLRDIGEKLNQVGGVLTNAGMGIQNTLMGTVNAYLQAAGQYDAEAQRWNAAQKEMQGAMTRIGAVALDKLTPYMEKAADLVDKLADFIEKNPGLIEAAAGAAVALSAAGEITKIAGTVSMLVGSVKDLSKILGGGGGGLLSGVLGSAKGLATGPLGVGAAALGAGAGLGNLAANAGGWLGAKATGQQYDWQSASDNLETIKKALSGSIGVLAMGAQDLGLISKDTAADIFQTAKSIVGLGEAAKDAGEKADGAKSAFDDSFVQSNVQDWIDYQKQLEDAQNQYKEQVTQVEQATEQRRTEIAQQYGEQRAELEQRYEQSRARAMSQFAQSEKDAEADYYRSRAEAARSYGEEVKRMEEDHQRQMRKLAEDHNERMGDLADSRDALGLVKEQKSYEKQRREEEENYKIEAKRKSEDFARQMADMEAQFRIQRDRRLRDFEQAQAEAEAQHVIDLAMLEKNRNEQLKAVEDGQKAQLDKLRAGLDAQTMTMQTNFNDRINAMSQSIAGDTQAYINYMQAQTEAFKQWLSQVGYGNGTGGLPPDERAAGGPVTAGSMYLVGERGPELFRPRTNGDILPAGTTASILRGGRGVGGARGQAANINITLQAGNLTAQQMRREIARSQKDLLGGIAAAMQAV